MVSSCVVGGCYNRTTSQSTRRSFLKFHRSPDDPTRRRQWDLRLNRQHDHVSSTVLKSYRVCSDHFNDCDYEEGDYLRYQTMGYASRMTLRLKVTALPNTDSETGAMRLYTGNSFRDQTDRVEQFPKRRRTVNLRTLGDMDSFSSQIDTAQYPYTADPSVEDADVQLDDDAPFIDSDTESVFSYSDHPYYLLPIPLSPKVASVQTDLTWVTQLENICDQNEDLQYYDAVQQLYSDSESDDDNGDDAEFCPSEDSDCDQEPQTDQNTKAKSDPRKNLADFLWTIISVEHLLSLFNWCPKCGSKAEVVNRYVVGFSSSIEYRCFGRKPHRGIWNSTPMNHRRYNLNVVLTTALSMCGVGYTAISGVFDVMKMPMISEKHFYKITKTWLNPVVYNMFIPIRDGVLDRIKSCSNLVLSGDGQFDSPGHSAKYCVYTLLDQASGHIVDFYITQRGLFAEELERAGCRELLLKLIEKGLKKFSFVTDRHSGIRCMLRDDPRFNKLVTHFFDIWHMAKSIGKDLTKLCKLKRNEILVPWKRAIINHFWYACRTSGGDKTKLVEVFHSFLLHITNAHSWTTGAFRKTRGQNLYPQFTKILKCAHGQLEKRQLRRGAWLKRTDRAFQDLFARVTRKELVEDMKQCANFLHTGSLENYHNVRLKYLPKRIHFTRETTAIRSMLVVIETNRNIRNDDSDVKMYGRWSKQSAKWVLKKGHEDKDYSFRHEIMEQICNNLSRGEKLAVDMTEYIPKNLPKNMAKEPRPDNDTMLRDFRTRMVLKNSGNQAGPSTQ